MKYLDYTIGDTWNTRIKSLGNSTYQDYLKSDHWKSVKKKASSRPNYQKCEFCQSTDVELHHTSYKCILTKFELRCIISLCRKHHQEIHNYSVENKCSVRIATNNLRKIYKPDYTSKNRLK